MTNAPKRINRRDFLLCCTAGAAGLNFSCMSGKNTGVDTGKKPNIIFILADDLGYGDLGCYGQKEIKTPNIDLLAEEGIRFTDHYAGSTVCAPSRCCLMTGYHTGHAYIRGNFEVKPMGQKPLRAGTVTVAKLLKEAGYATALFGKWGLGALVLLAFPITRVSITSSAISASDTHTITILSSFSGTRKRFPCKATGWKIPGRTALDRQLKKPSTPTSCACRRL